MILNWKIVEVGGTVKVQTEFDTMEEAIRFETLLSLLKTFVKGSSPAGVAEFFGEAEKAGKDGIIET